MNGESNVEGLNETGKYLLHMAGELRRPVFSIKDIGIRHQQVNNWRVQEVLLSNEAKGRKGKNPFSMMDYIWMRMLENLREIGVHVPIIKKAREALLEPTPISDIAFAPVSKDSKGGNISPEIIEGEISLLEFFVINALIQKQHVAVFIDEMGQVYPYSTTDPLSWIMDIELRWLMARPYVSVSISEIIKEIVDVGEEEGDDRRLVLITEEEREVLDMIREGQLSELRIRFDQNHEIDLIEATKKEKVDLKNRFMDVITREGYQDISFTTQRGKVVHFQNTTKIKPKLKRKN